MHAKNTMHCKPYYNNVSSLLFTLVFDIWNNLDDLIECMNKELDQI